MIAIVDFDAITALKDEAAALQEEANGYEEQFRDAISRRDEKLAKMREVMDQIKGSTENQVSQPVSATMTPRSSPKSSVKPSVHVNRGRKSNSGQKPLKEVVLEIFQRKSWMGFEGIDAIAAKNNGLRITDVGKIVKSEGQWTTGSGNMDNQINNAVYALKNEGILDRNKTEEHGVRYFIKK